MTLLGRIDNYLSAFAGVHIVIRVFIQFKNFKYHVENKYCLLFYIFFKKEKKKECPLKFSINVSVEEHKMKRVRHKAFSNEANETQRIFSCLMVAFSIKMLKSKINDPSQSFYWIIIHTSAFNHLKIV